MTDLTNEERRQLLRTLRNTRISVSHTALAHAVNIPVATYAPWFNDAVFMNTFEAIKPNTLVDIYRCFELWSLVAQLNKVPGDILEVGVWRGGTGCLMATQAANLNVKRTIFLCDTFSGVVKATAKDTHYKGGEHADTTQQVVETLIAQLGLDNTKILKGIFPDETGHAIQDAQIALCHIDVDVYESGLDVFNWANARMGIGAMVVFDDYGFLGCEGITKLANELSLREDFICVANLNGHAVFIKIRS